MPTTVGEVKHSHKWEEHQAACPVDGRAVSGKTNHCNRAPNAYEFSRSVEGCHGIHMMKRRNEEHGIKTRRRRLVLGERGVERTDIRKVVQATGCCTDDPFVTVDTGHVNRDARQTSSEESIPAPDVKHITLCTAQSFTVVRGVVIPILARNPSKVALLLLRQIAPSSRESIVLATE